MKKCFLIIIIVLFYIICNTSNYIDIPESAIRLRIIADSNSKSSQKIKLEVKKNLEKIIYPIIEDAKDEGEVQSLLEENMDYIKKEIENTLKSNASEENYSINLGLNYFPEKKYKGVVYKSGEYNSLFITLGKGKGDNFWCMLYPPLCLEDTSKVYKYHSLIKDILNKYN